MRFEAFDSNAGGLIISIIGQAIRDYKTNIYKEHAKRFLLSEDCKYMCEVMNVDHKKLLIKLGLGDTY